MLHLKLFTFNPFYENTYILYDETKSCVIIDPGCYEAAEKRELFDFIITENLKPVRLLNTHCHIDHILGNKFVAESFGLKVEIHEFEHPLLKATIDYGSKYGIMVEESPEPLLSLREGEELTFGNSTLKIIFAPGHSPGSVCFYSEADGILIGGDVLFRESIGRTDFPASDSATLLRSIRNNLFILPDDTIVFPGHGQETTIGYEKKNNPFLLTHS